MFLKRFVYLFLGTLIFSFPACGAMDVIPLTGRDGGESSLSNTRWGLVSYGQSGAETPVMEGSGVTLEIVDDNQARGSTGCNTYGAQYHVSMDNQLTITDVASTLMACNDETLMEQERQYLAALRSAESFNMTDETLTISYAGGALNFLRVTSNAPGSVHI